MVGHGQVFGVVLEFHRVDHGRRRLHPIHYLCLKSCINFVPVHGGAGRSQAVEHGNVNVVGTSHFKPLHILQLGNRGNGKHVPCAHGLSAAGYKSMLLQAFGYLRLHGLDNFAVFLIVLEQEWELKHLKLRHPHSWSGSRRCRHHLQSACLAHFHLLGLASQLIPKVSRGLDPSPGFLLHCLAEKLQGTPYGS